ncbi:hypothetical protein JHW43_008666 [Diplocarpon mali]|nr:hypothetical protein JHW43_008666 [Diplocarpon mali]
MSRFDSRCEASGDPVAPPISRRHFIDKQFFSQPSPAIPSHPKRNLISSRIRNHNASPHQPRLIARRDSLPDVIYGFGCHPPPPFHTPQAQDGSETNLPSLPQLSRPPSLIMALDNANPTILSESELPSHRRRRRNRGDGPKESGIRELLRTKSVHALDPFNMLDSSDTDSDHASIEPIDEKEIYDLIAPISDPEHPLSLESLGVVKLQDVHLTSPPDLANPAALSRVLVELTPTVSHCSLATVIGLGVRVRLEQALPPSYRVEVQIKEGTHGQADEVNKQLADKERVAAALENENLMGILKTMMRPCMAA